MAVEQYSKDAEMLVKKLRAYVINNHCSKVVRNAVDEVSLEMIGETWPWPSKK